MKATSQLRCFLLILVVVSGLAATCAGAAGSDALMVGVSKVDITPEKPVQMMGYASRKDLSTGVHDPLFLRVTAFQQGNSRLVVVSIDNLGFYRGTYEYMMEGITAELGLSTEEVILAAIHTHSAPTLTIDEEEGHPNNLAYTKNLRGVLIDTIREAESNLQPVRVGVGWGESAVGVNRREQRPNGSVTLGRNPQGVHDSEVLVLDFQKADGTPLVSIYDYATHATSLGNRNYLISGDLIGIASSKVEEIRGGDVIVAALVGASGDIDPWYRVLPGFRSGKGWVPETELLGQLLATDVVHALERIEEYAETATFDSVASQILLPGKKRGQSIPEDGDDVPDVPLNLIAARIGDVGFLGMSAEVLTEVGWAIKRGSPFDRTMIVTHCNGARGYLPPAHRYKEGGYEIETSPYAPGAADRAVKEALRLLHDLKRAQGEK